MITTGSGIAVPGAGITNVQHVSNGEIIIKTVSQADAGVYKLTVQYSLTSGLLSDRDSVIVTVFGKLLSVVLNVTIC